MATRDLYAKLMFRLEIDGVSPGGFQSCAGLSWESEVLEFQEGGRNDAMVRLPGQGKLGTVSLTRGFIDNPDFAEWADKAAKGESMRRNVDIVVLDLDRQEVARYTLLRAWPSKLDVKELASQQGAHLESLELSHEGILRGGQAPAPPPGNVAGVFGPVQAAVQAAEQRARDAARAARQAGDAASAAADAARSGTGANLPVPGMDGGGAGAAEDSFPMPPPAPSGVSPLDAFFAAGATAAAVAATGDVNAGLREALSLGSPPGDVTAHASAEGFADATSGAPPGSGPGEEPPPAPGGAGSAGFAQTGERGSAATATGAWSDGVERQQPPGQLREPPIQQGNTLQF